MKNHWKMTDLENIFVNKTTLEEMKEDSDVNYGGLNISPSDSNQGLTIKFILSENH